MINNGTNVKKIEAEKRNVPSASSVIETFQMA